MLSTRSFLFAVLLVLFCAPADAGVRRRAVAPKRALQTAQPSSFTYYATAFNGLSQAMSNNAPTVADGDKGTLSFWVNFSGGDGTNQYIINNGNSRFYVYKSTLNKILVRGARPSDGAEVIVIAANGPFVSTSGWIHFLTSWDLSVGTRYHIYTNGVDGVTKTTFTAGESIDYAGATTKWVFGAKNDGTVPLTGAVSEFFFAPVYLDLTDANNRLLFSSTSTTKGVPVDLTAAIATTGAPWMYFAGDYTTFGSNSGSSGNFTIIGGPLTDAVKP